MDIRINDDIEFLHSLIDSIPYLVFVVDSDVRIFYVNAAASCFLDDEIGRLRMRRGGEVLNCLHSHDVPEGCGHADFCRNCIVRNSVNEAVGGCRIYHRQSAMKLVRDGIEIDINLLVSASPFMFRRETFVLLMLEDIDELVQLRNCLPICANCKKIRNDENYWESVEHYLTTRHDLDFTHSICPDCKKTLYPELGGKNH